MSENGVLKTIDLRIQALEGKKARLLKNVEKLDAEISVEKTVRERVQEYIGTARPVEKSPPKGGSLLAMEQAKKNRQAVFNHLMKSRDLCTATDISIAVGLSPSGVRNHLMILEKKGKVEHVREPGKANKPTDFWSVKGGINRT